jgi:hypothetical protein
VACREVLQRRLQQLLLPAAGAPSLQMAVRLRCTSSGLERPWRRPLQLSEESCAAELRAGGQLLALHAGGQQARKGRQAAQCNKKKKQQAQAQAQQRRSAMRQLRPSASPLERRRRAQRQQQSWPWRL